jgi:Leucine-rich repeat (LRR) protein
VTNSSGLLDNLLNEDTNNFDIIRGPSEKLFCFDTISLTFLIRSIRPDAKYLFSSLSRLEIVTPGFWRSTFRPEVVLHVMVKSFEECCTNKIDFIDLAIRHPEQSRGFPNFQLKDDCDFPDLSSLVAQSEVKALTLTNFTENFQNYLQMFQNGHDDFNTNNNLWSKLVELNLNDSRIKLTDNSNNAFDPRLFEVLPKLEKLNVRINFRFCLDKKLFERASNLTYLAMMKNDIDYIKHDSFNGLVNLRILSLRATRIDFKAFTCLYKLEELTLRTDALETVDTTTFAGLTKLKVLDLKDCSINYVDPTAFDHMKELEILDLSYNYLEEIKFTNAAPGSIKFQGNSYLKLVQFDSSCVFKISEILLPYGCFSKSAKETGTFASLLPMDGLRKLTMTAMRTMPFNQCMNLNELILILTNFQVLEQGQLSCLSNLTKLKFHMGRSILDNQGNQVL